MELVRDVVKRRETMNAEDPWSNAPITIPSLPLPPLPVDIFDTLTRQMREEYARMVGIELDRIDRLATDND